jgi:serine/threonine protein kinase
MKGIKQIKNYRLTREIGRGTAGTVYEAIDDKTNKLVAVKSIQSLKLKDKRVMENFKRELKLLHGLNHNNIIKITGVEKTVNNIYLILEYCNGGNLYEYLHFYKKTYGNPLPEENVQVILRQLIDGLEYMHNCRTIHRDIKLENILVNFNSVSNQIKPGAAINKIDYSQMDLLDITVKIADLGYARELEGAGVASTMCGTPITMAPDIIGLFNNNDVNKDNRYNTKADLWSLGAITYELLVGRPVFISNNVKQLFEEIMSGKYSIPENLKISLEAISFINGLLQFYPDKRMTWNQIRNHPFIVNDIENFHFIDLTTVDKHNEKVLIDTKNCENFLWVLYKTNFSNNITIDKIDNEVFEAKAHESVQIGKKSVQIKPAVEQPSKTESSDKDLIIDVAPRSTRHEVNIQSVPESIPLKEEEAQREDNKKDEFEEIYEEPNNEICICDDEVKTGKAEDNIENIEIKKEKLIEENILRKTENHGGNKIFGKLLSEMEQELKSSKNSSKVSNPELNNTEKKEIKQEVKKDVDSVETEINKDKLKKDDEVKEISTVVIVSEEKDEKAEEIKNTIYVNEAATEEKELKPEENNIDSYYDCGANAKDVQVNKIESYENVQQSDSVLQEEKQNNTNPLEEEQNALTQENPQEIIKTNNDQDSYNKQAEEIVKADTITEKEQIKSSNIKSENNRESNLIQFDSISDERVSANYKGNRKNILNLSSNNKLVTISMQKSLSNEYLEVNKESEDKSDDKDGKINIEYQLF